MRVARVAVNETCNQNCSFCNARRSSERAAVASGEAIRARLDDALKAGASTIVLTGGEPTLRRDLAGLIAYTKSAGAERVVLETNATLIAEERARALRRAGLDAARAHLPAWGESADRTTRDPGGFARARAGLAALAAAGVELEVAIPVARANAGDIEELPRALADSGLPIAELYVVVPTAAPQREAVLPLRRAAELVSRLATASTAAGMNLRLAPHALIPPCAFETPAHVAHLYSLTPGGANRPGYARERTCGECVVADRCPGIPEVLRAGPKRLSPQPIADDRVRRRLSLIGSVDEQIARELVTREMYRRVDGKVDVAHTVRINFHCNQACGFCFVSTHLPAAAESAIRAAVIEIARAGGVLVLSGGEPTLNPRLLDYVRLGRAEGAAFIELQTNATLLGDGDRAEALWRAGVSDALVSLHGSNSAISDAITGVPGSFERTVRGLSALVATEIRVRLNFVFCDANLTDFPAYVARVAESWPGVSLTVSFVAGSTDVVPLSAALVPRYSDMLPQLREGLSIAREAGIEVDGLDSMCGIPLCLAPGDRSRFFSLAEIPAGFDRGEFVEAEACRGCALASRCFGVRRGYAELHGTDELSPVSPEGVQGGSGTSSS